MRAPHAPYITHVFDPPTEEAGVEGRIAMGLLDKLFGRGQASQKRDGLHPASSGADCPHLAVAPRWDNGADIGVEALVCRAQLADVARGGPGLTC